MRQPHQHGPNCRHGHGNGGHGIQHGGHGMQHGGHGMQHGSHGMQQGGPGGAIQMSPQQYFKKLSEMKTQVPEFYYMQIISGRPFDKYLQQKGWDCLRSITLMPVVMLIAQVQFMLSCEWIPLYLRPFVSGLFFPLIILMCFNSNIIDGFDEKINPSDKGMLMMMYFTAIFYIITALRESGAINTERNQLLTAQAIKERIYLQNPGANCQKCKILKAFRAFHCPMCNVCVSKFTKHSQVFNICIGSTNELVALLFFVFLTITQAITIGNFFMETSYGILTQLFIYFLNVYILWISLVEAIGLFIFVIFLFTFFLYLQNFYFGITEHEIRMWQQSKYLMKIPQGVFANTINLGLCHNFKESIYAFFNISGIESQKPSNKKKYNPIQDEIKGQQQSGFEDYEKGKHYTVNWNRAFYFMTPQIPYHPQRNEIIEIMAKEEPRMIEMFKLQKKFKVQVLKQNEGQNLNEFQIQQKVQAKLQQHLMKNSPQMMMGRQPPSQEDQKKMQIQMLTHMKQQMGSNEPEFAQKIGSLLQKLTADEITPMEVGMSMRQLQQEIMKKKMEQVMRERQQQQKQAELQAKAANQKDKQEEEEKLKEDDEVRDEDL